MNQLINKQMENPESARHLRGLHAACLAMTTAICLSVAQPAYAEFAGSKEEAGEVALSQVEGEGKVLSIEEEGPHFKVKVLVDGKVSVVIVIRDPAATE